MSDLSLIWNGTAADLGIFENDLQTDEGLENAVLISLFTDRRLAENDEPPDGESDRRGWWADDLPFSDGDLIGSRLWTLGREKQEQSVLTRAREYVIEALQWMIDDQLALRVDVVTAIVGAGWLGISITIYRPKLAPLALRRYDFAWAAQLLRRP